MERDFRFKNDLVIPASVVLAYPAKLQAYKDIMADLFSVSVNSEGWAANESVGFIKVERCGHRIGEPCEIIAKWEVGIGQVL